MSYFRAWAFRQGNRCFPERLQRARTVVTTDTNESPSSFYENLLGAYTEFAFMIDTQTL